MSPITYYNLYDNELYFCCDQICNGCLTRPQKIYFACGDVETTFEPVSHKDNLYGVSGKQRS